MTLVVDASVAAKWYLAEEGSDRAEAILRRREHLLAPDILPVELANVFWKAVRLGRMAPDDARRAIRGLSSPLMFVAADGLTEDAFTLGLEIDHPIYDCLYLALAAREGARFVTADQRLYRRVQSSRWAERCVLLENEVER